MSSPAEAAEAATLAGDYPVLEEGEPQLLLGTVGAAPCIEAQCIATLRQLLACHCLVGRYPDFRIFSSLPVLQREGM